MRPGPTDTHGLIRRRELFDWLRAAVIFATLVGMFVSGRDDLRQLKEQFLEIKARISHIETYLERDTHGKFTTREDDGDGGTQ